MIYTHYKLLSNSGFYLQISTYFYYDAALVLKKAITLLTRSDIRQHRTDTTPVNPSLNCLDAVAIPRPKGYELSRTIEKVRLPVTLGFR